uniref:Uncharacterized protein n=1 Tax=Neobodo designis TaxID=312471 RepID=A0A7S1QDI9_NEODS
MRVPRRLRDFMTWPELQRRAVLAWRELRPLPVGTLLPIEACGVSDCPRFCDRLESAELLEPHTAARFEVLRRRRQFWCGTCSTVVPIRRAPNQRRDDVGDPYAVVRQPRAAFLRRPRVQPTYGVAVIDDDGTSAVAFLRCLRAQQFVGSSPWSWWMPDASSGCYLPCSATEVAPARPSTSCSP